MWHYNNGVAKVVPIPKGIYPYVVECRGAGIKYFHSFDAACLFADDLAGLL